MLLRVYKGGHGWAAEIRYTVMQTNISICVYLSGKSLSERTRFITLFKPQPTPHLLFSFFHPLYCLFQRSTNCRHYNASSNNCTAIRG